VIASILVIIMSHPSNTYIDVAKEPHIRCRPRSPEAKGQLWETICKTVSSMLWDRCPVCLQRWCIVPKRLDGSRCHLVWR